MLRPGIEPIIYRDLFLFRTLASFLNGISLQKLGCNAELIVDEFGEKLLEELDYTLVLSETASSPLQIREKILFIENRKKNVCLCQIGELDLMVFSCLMLISINLFVSSMKIKLPCMHCGAFVQFWHLFHLFS